MGVGVGAGATAKVREVGREGGVERETESKRERERERGLGTQPAGHLPPTTAGITPTDDAAAPGRSAREAACRQWGFHGRQQSNSGRSRPDPPWPLAQQVHMGLGILGAARTLTHSVGLGMDNL
ncbi:hypothetical protein JZ751_007855 [Albula glossodonta]|uniref:Uncharacterized protein n=1 Tax=Albula glossodonta TaxID=121402 RepID=A0A8T2P2S3_9TELE|nr:hypothetical protein JZ751_007855 [Albula glossodonta]